MLPVGVLSLLLVTAQAATAITSERDTGALDLLLVTDLSPREFIFGKLLGILYNTKEYLLPPLLLTGVYGVYRCLATPPAVLSTWELQFSSAPFTAKIAETEFYQDPVDPNLKCLSQNRLRQQLEANLPG